MLKLGYTSSLAISLAFAGIHASIQQNNLALSEVADALGWFDRLTQIGVQLDPLTQIRPRLQDMLDDGNASQSVIDDVSDKLAQSYANLQIPVLLDAYQLGQLLGAAEALATTNANSNRLAIGEFAKQAADLADSLSNDTPLSVPLNLSDVPGSLRTIASQEATAAFNDLHNSLLFVRGKCQGIFDVTGPENF